MKISKAAYDVLKDEFDWWVEYHTKELLEAKEKISTDNYDSKNLLRFAIPSNKKNLAIANEILGLLKQLEVIEFENLKADLSVMNQVKNIELSENDIERGLETDRKNKELHKNQHGEE